MRVRDAAAAIVIAAGIGMLVFLMFGDSGPEVPPNVAAAEKLEVDPVEPIEKPLPPPSLVAKPAKPAPSSSIPAEDRPIDVSEGQQIALELNERLSDEAKISLIQLGAFGSEKAGVWLGNRLRSQYGYLPESQIAREEELKEEYSERVAEAAEEYREWIIEAERVRIDIGDADCSDCKEIYHYTAFLNGDRVYWDSEKHPEAFTHYMRMRRAQAEASEALEDHYRTHARQR